MKGISNKTTIVICLILVSIFSCSKGFSSQSKDLSDLETYWSAFEHLTEKDSIVLKKLKTHYINTLEHPKVLAENKIPKIIHLIWIGPNSFPEKSKVNVSLWIEKHPDYTVKFWTDRKRNNMPKGLSTVFIKSDYFSYFLDEYIESENYAEKADLLRYEILLKEGGIYVDHDVIPYQSIEKVSKNIDFFCGLEPPHLPVGESSITVCNNLIGSCPNHIILEKTISRIKRDWNSIGITYQGKPKEYVNKRVFLRTFLPFSDIATDYVHTEGFSNLILPPCFFNDIGGKKGLFAHHQYASSWFENETKSEKLIRTKLEKVNKKINKLMLIFGITFSVFLIFLLFLLKSRTFRNLKSEN